MDLGNGTSGQRDLNPKHQPKDPVSNDSTSAELVMSQFRGLVGSLFRSPIASKRCIRDWVVDNVAVGRRLSERVECILEHAVLSTKPSRLDDAIDILDQPRVDLTTYLRDAQFRGSLDRKPEDAIYILVRAAGRRSDDAARFVVPWALKSDQASVREAAVEALADLGTEAAISMLRRVSQFDDSSSVRETAKEVLEDIVEG
ncbi:MAG: HEAT repeat domain-containing protein [Phycisphaerales bacterium]|nr:HEAT repeat domain-containing protein [Phycisphaerales bacterium]